MPISLVNSVGGWQNGRRRVCIAVIDSGQSEAFASLAVPLLRPLYNFAHWLTRDHHEAEDLVQDAYARAIKGFSSFKPGTNFRAWMFRILRNTFLTSRMSKKGTDVPLEEEGEIVDSWTM